MSKESNHIVAIPLTREEEQMITCYRFVTKTKDDFYECPICNVKPDRNNTYEHDGPLERQRKGTLN